MRNILLIQLQTKVALAIILVIVVIVLITIFKSMDDFNKFIDQQSTQLEQHEEVRD